MMIIIVIVIFINVEPKKLSGAIHVSLGGLLEWGEGWSRERGGEPRAGWTSTGAKQQESRYHGDGQEEGDGAWVHGEPCSNGGCGVGWAAVGACGHGGGDVRVGGGVPPWCGVCAVIRDHLVRGRGAEELNLKHQWMQNILVRPWLNRFHSFRLNQFSKFSFWWNPPELRSTEQNRTEQVGSTQIPWRACQITAGTPHREETLDPLPQVDNALLWIFNYGASKATKKRNKCKRKRKRIKESFKNSCLKLHLSQISHRICFDKYNNQ